MKKYKQMAEATKLLSKNGKTKETVEKINQSLQDVGFEVVESMTDHDISTFTNRETGEYHISHRGTMFRSDHLTNAAVGVGLSSAALKRRNYQTEKIVEQIPGSSKVTMSGYSLGGYSALSSMVDSKAVRNKISEVHTFNSGSHLLSPSHDTLKELDKKVTHHVIEGDRVSSWMTKFATPFGTVKKYKSSSNLKHDLENFPEIEPKMRTKLPTKLPTKQTSKRTQNKSVRVNVKELCRKFPQLNECKSMQLEAY